MTSYKNKQLQMNELNTTTFGSTL